MVTFAVLSRVNAGFTSAVIVTVSVGEVAVPFEADATLVMKPASKSACVILYVCVTVRLSPGAIDPIASATVILSSLIENGPSNVTFPELIIL